MTGSGSIILVSAASLVLCGLAATLLRGERTPARRSVAAALLVTALLELFDLCAVATGDGMWWKRYSILAESLLPLCWVLCGLTYARQNSVAEASALQKTVLLLTVVFPVTALLVPLDLFLYAPDFPEELVLFTGNAGFLFYSGIVACLLFALVHFERTLTSASPDALWKAKYQIVGLGAIVSALVFYYSQSFLYRTLNMNYLPFRSVIYLAAAALMTYSRISRRGSVSIRVSRRAAYKSLVVISVTAYLAVLVLLGEGMQYLSSPFHRSVTVSTAFLAGILLLLLLLSQRVRREVRVILHKNFYRSKYDYRTQWLDFTRKLSASRSGDELLQHILSAFCGIFGVRGAAMFLDDDNGGYSVCSVHEMDPAQDSISAENAVVRFMKERAWVVNVSEADPEILGENREFFRSNKISFLVPLFAGERLQGFIILGQAVKKDEVYIYEDYDLMKTIGRQASVAILQQRLSEQISQSRELAAIGHVAAFVVHDLKNLVSGLSLLVQNGARHIRKPEFQHDLMVTLGNTVEKMQGLVGRLHNLGEEEPNRQQVNLLELVEKTAGMVKGAPITVSGTPETAYVDEGELQKVVLNLLLNGVEASGPDVPVLAEVGSAGAPYIRVTDHGCGMSRQFIRTSLFKPFRTTKKQGLGIGLYQCRRILEPEGGRIEVNSVEGDGSVFTVWLPPPSSAAGQSIQP